MIDWNPIAEKFREADAILIGASNGLSITEGCYFPEKRLPCVQHLLPESAQEKRHRL